jgi:hypothetical protein
MTNTEVFPYQVLVGKPEGISPRELPKPSLQGSIKKGITDSLTV